MHVCTVCAVLCLCVCVVNEPYRGIKCNCCIVNKPVGPVTQGDRAVGALVNPVANSQIDLVVVFKQNQIFFHTPHYAAL